MASRLTPPALTVAIISAWLLLSPVQCAAVGAAASAVYVMGDSLADVGNNNYLGLTLLRADFPHNGVDYPSSEATGRFSNGLVFPDLLAQKLGLTSPPPFLSLQSDSVSASSYLPGVNFASGGAGISETINEGQCISFDEQIDDFSTVYGALVQQLGEAEALAHLRQSVFAVVVGSNDVINYATSSTDDITSNPPQFVDSLVLTLKGQLQRIYNLGARKLVLLGAGPVGCTPSLREQNSSHGCNSYANAVAVQFNTAVAAMLHDMARQLSDFHYSFFDAASALLQYIQRPADYGFTEVRAACCGLGDLNAKIACIPLSEYCSNRANYVFWDYYHPTEAATSMLTAIAFDGVAPFVYPINIKQLSAL